MVTRMRLVFTSFLGEPFRNKNTCWYARQCSVSLFPDTLFSHRDAFEQCVVYRAYPNIQNLFAELQITDRLQVSTERSCINDHPSINTGFSKP